MLQRQLIPPNSSKQYNSDSELNNPINITQEEQYFNVTKRLKRTLDDSTSQSSINFLEIKSMFADIKEQQEKKFDELSNALLQITTQNQDIQNSISKLTKQYEDLYLEIKVVKEENIEFKQRICALENKLEIQEKRACSTMLEIRNVPIITTGNKKDLTCIITKIGETVGLEPPIIESEIRDIYQKKPEVLVVDFSSNQRKEAFLKRFKIYNKSRRDMRESKLQTQQINIAGPPRPLYMSESLTSKKRRIFYLAREKVRNKVLAATWTAYGSVFIKTDESSSPIRIDEEDQLQKFTL